MPLPLRVAELKVRAPNGRVLLDVPELQVSPVQAIGVRGASGAGKSTLLFALAGLLDDISGSLTWGDTDLLHLSKPRRAAFRAQHMGLIFQDFLLFEELNALSNASLSAMFSPRTERQALETRTADKLARLGLNDHGRRVDSFSGGERQRVAVARALANDPAILLADEPTASLHRDAADRLIEDLVSLARDDGRTLIAVSHDPALLARMDRVLTLADGRIAADETREA